MIDRRELRWLRLRHYRYVSSELRSGSGSTEVPYYPCLPDSLPWVGEHQTSAATDAPSPYSPSEPIGLCCTLVSLASRLYPDFDSGRAGFPGSCHHHTDSNPVSPDYRHLSNNTLFVVLTNCCRFYKYSSIPCYKDILAIFLASRYH
jgi:hypothetical protein